VAGGDVKVQRQELGQEVSLGVEAVGREDGSIQGRMGVLERVLARQLEGAVKSPQAAPDPRQRLGPDPADFAARRGDGLDAGDGGGGERPFGDPAGLRRVGIGLSAARRSLECGGRRRRQRPGDAAFAAGGGTTSQSGVAVA
jgi:hypothetical protein